MFETTLDVKPIHLSEASIDSKIGKKAEKKFCVFLAEAFLLGKVTWHWPVWQMCCS